MTVKQVQEVANMANKMLIISEMIENIGNGKLEPWSPINIIVDAIGKDNLQEALFHHLSELKREFKENITLL